MIVGVTVAVSCYVNEKGNLMVSSSFATIEAMTDLSIKVKMMNPYKEFACEANSLNVF